MLPFSRFIRRTTGSVAPPRGASDSRVRPAHTRTNVASAGARTRAHPRLPPWRQEGAVSTYIGGAAERDSPGAVARPEGSPECLVQPSAAINEFSSRLARRLASLPRLGCPCCPFACLHAGLGRPTHVTFIDHLTSRSAVALAGATKTGGSSARYRIWVASPKRNALPTTVDEGDALHEIDTCSA